MVFVLSDNYEHYVDARRDVRWPDHVCLEEVRNGHVVRRMKIQKQFAPEKIIDWVTT